MRCAMQKPNMRYPQFLSVALLVGLFLGQFLTSQFVQAQSPEVTASLTTLQSNSDFTGNSGRCLGGTRQSFSLDGVKLELCLPFNPDHISIAMPGDWVQAGSWVEEQPYRVLSLYAVPYGVKPAADGLPKSAKWIKGVYKQATRNFYKAKQLRKDVGPNISFFGEIVEGATFLLPDENSSNRNAEKLVTEWITEAGDKVWILRAISYGEFSDSSDRDGVLASLGTITLESSTLAEPSTSLKAHRKTGSAKELISKSNLADLPSVNWWDGDCDKNRYLSLTGVSSSRLGAIFRNLVACGPGGVGTGKYAWGISTTFGGAGGSAQLEFQCAELPKRYLYLLYGLPPRSANGVDVVKVYDNALPNLKMFANGKPNFGLAAGDILSYETPSVYGHTSIVTSVTWTDAKGNGTYTIIEQNSSASGERTNTITNWWLNSNSPVTYVLHDSNNEGGITIPTGLTASDGAFIDKIQVDWDGVSGATNYELYRNTSDAAAGSTLLTTTITPGYADNAVTVGLTYWYFVKACDLDGCSDYSLSNSGYRASAVPRPLSPNGSITDVTPTFQWTQVPGATQYRYRVFLGDSILAVRVKTVTNSACAGAYCTHTPIKGLPYGAYKWQVRTYLNGAWKAWSGQKVFNLTDPAFGFDSQFNRDMTGWGNMGRTTWDVSTTSLNTLGIPGYWAQAYLANAEYTDFDYSVRVKRINSEFAANYLMVRMGTSTGTYNDYWYPGYLFGYRNTGEYSIWMLNEDGSSLNLQPWTQSSSVVPYDWNTLRLVANGSLMEFYINGDLVNTVNDTTRNKGYVGLGIFDRGDASDKFLVDWAMLTTNTSSAKSGESISPEQLAHNQAAMDGEQTDPMDGTPR